MDNKLHNSSVALISAVKNGQVSFVKELLSNGADPNSANDFSSTALTFSIINQNQEICMELLKAGADPDIKNQNGVSPLDFAIQNNYSNFVKLIQTFKSKNKQSYKKKRFSFKVGQSTKKVHLEYKEFPRLHEFEHQYYKDTIELVMEEIAVKKQKIRQKDLGGADARTNDILAGLEAKKIPKLEHQALKPYYARLDIKSKNGEIHSYYLGARAITDDRVYAPQSRIGRLYAQKTLGKTKDKDLGEIEVTLIRHIENESGIIYQIIDKEWSEATGFVDPILMKKLNEHAKAKMNEIWETIQGEQDSVMRQGISEPIIVQGSAGSGKTVIALHRLSYLLYNYPELEQQKEKVMILGPNTMYLKYIQDALPHLDVGDIQQATFEKFCTDRIPFKKSKFIIVYYHDVIKKGLAIQDVIASKVKGSLFYQKALLRYLEDLIEALLPTEEVVAHSEFGNIAFTKERIKELFTQYCEQSTVEVARNRVIEIMKAETTRFINKLTWEDSSKDLEKNKKTLKFSKEITKKLNAFIKSWPVPNAFQIYKGFATNKSNLIEYIPEQYLDYLDGILEENARMLEQSKVTVDDLPALLEIQQWLTGTIGTFDENDSTKLTNQKFHYVLIDEAQDYSPYQLSIINSLVRPGRIMLLGDLGQSIYDFRGINNWNDAIRALGIDENGKYTYLELSTIYRSTVQIVKFANEIIRPYSKDRYTLSEPVGRDGVEPIIDSYKDNADQLSKMKMMIEQMNKEGYENIAIITRNWEEATQVYKGIKKHFPKIKLVTEGTDEYKGGIIVIPLYLTKGIEFDSVIITNASMENYLDDDYHRKLLYVSVTRALHQVAILYDTVLTLPLLDVVNKDEANRIREEIKQKLLEEQRQRELEDQKRKELEEQRQKRELEEQKRRELEEQKQRDLEQQVPDKDEIAKSPFLLVIEKEFNKLIKEHQQEVNQLNQKIKQLERELQKQNNSNTNWDYALSDNLIESNYILQKQALFNHYMLNSDLNGINEFFYSILSWDIKDQQIIILQTLHDILIHKKYSVVSDILNHFIEIMKEDSNPSKELIQLLNDVLEEIFFNTGVGIDNLDLIFNNSLSLLSCLAGSPVKDYFYDFLEWNANLLIDILFEFKSLPLLIKVIQVNLEYELTDSAKTLVNRLLEDLNKFDSQLSKEYFSKLLWYSFYFNMDNLLLELVPSEFIDSSVPEVQLYFTCYDLLNGDDSEFVGLEEKMTMLSGFSQLEKAIIVDRILHSQQAVKS